MHSSRAVRWVAALEGLKGDVVLLAAFGVLGLIHHDVHQWAANLIEHAHLNPASKYPKIVLDAAAQVNDPRLWQLAAGALAYSVVRLVEAFGLYHGRVWAEMLGAVSGAIYVPFEIGALVHRPSFLSAALLALNLAVVSIMVYALQVRRRRVNH
jgi:uncharacterized membrane protein (DUF2068 family)